MQNLLRFSCGVLSLLLHLALIAGAVLLSGSSDLRVNPQRIYEVDLVGPVHIGKAGIKGQQRKKPDIREKKETGGKKRIEEAAQKKAVQKKSPEVFPEKKTEILAQKIPLENATLKQPAPKKAPEVTKTASKPAEKNETVDGKILESTAKKAEKKDATGKTAKKTQKTSQKTASSDAAEAVDDALAELKKAQSGDSSEGDARDAALRELRAGSGNGETGTGSGSSGDGEGLAIGNLVDWYATQVMKTVKPHWRAIRMPKTLAATIEVHVAPTGEILASRLTKSSGFPGYDASLLQAIADTPLLPALPAGLPSQLQITFYSNELL